MSRILVCIVLVASAFALMVACSSSETVHAEPDAAVPASAEPFDAGDPDASEDGGSWTEDQCCRAVLWGDRRGDACCKRWIDEALRDH